MIAVTIFYPGQPDSHFDFQYYSQSHMPMIVERMAGACRHYWIEKGLPAGALVGAAQYCAIGHLHFESVQAFETAFFPHATEITADVKNYTNITPILQVSEVLAD